MFTKEECEKILEFTKIEEGILSNPYYSKSEYYVWYIHRNSDTEWIFEKIFKYVKGIVKINKELNMLFLQSVKEGSEFETHIDVSEYFNVGVCLNDDYVGGELYVLNSNYNLPKKQGTIYLFEGYKPHGINKVISGQRYALVGFFEKGDLNFNKLL